MASSRRFSAFRRKLLRRDVFLFRMFHATVRVLREATLLPRMYGRVVREWPAPELRALVVAERLLQLGAGVHDERPILGNRLADRTSLQKQDLNRAAVRL